MNICRKVEKWLQTNPNQSLPDWILDHIENCPLCEKIITSSSVLKKFTPITTNVPSHFSSDLDWKIRNCIFTTADRIQSEKATKRKTSSFARRGFVVALSTICILVAAIFTVPVANTNTTFSLLLNEKFKEVMKSPPSNFLLEAEFTSPKEEHLQFARYFCETKEEREFLYSNNENNRNMLLFVKFIGMNSDVSYHTIYQYAQRDLYFQAIRNANLPLWKTWREFNSYLEQFNILPGQPFESFDASVLSIDYTTGAVGVDVFAEPLYADFIIMQQIIPFKTYHFTVKTVTSKTYIVAIDLPVENDTSIQGTVLSVEKNTCRLDSFPETLFVSEKVLQGEPASSRLNKEDYLFVRATQSLQDKWVVTSLSILHKPSERTLTGHIAEKYHNGFTLDNLDISFIFSSSQNSTLNQYDTVTIQGMDYGAFFMVEEIVSHIPYIEEKQEYYLASHQTETVKKESSSSPTRTIATKTPTKPLIKKQLESDIVVGVKENLYYLLSGKVIAKDQVSQVLSVGESIRYEEDRSFFNIQNHFINQAKVVQFPVEYLEQLPSGIDIFHNPQDGSRIYILHSSSSNNVDTSMFQGKVVSYGSIHVALEWRMFSLSTLVNIQAVVTKEIEYGSLYLLDNGCVLRIDDLTEIQGNLQIGKTVKISGQYDQNVLKGYIVRVEKEIFLMQGEIVQWNEDQKWFLLDNGIVIQIHDTTIFHGQGLFDEGVFIYCKVYLKDGQYIASDIGWEKSAIPGSGDRI
ncbi:MAG TPA: hypothetical protein PLV00_03210 [Caldisericia bacterium]|nr:hypothetical protein [Caldisericia bacterium]